MSKYLFTSQRLGFRNWLHADIAPMAAINADPDVMEFFPGTKSYKETEEFIERMQRQMADRDYCYFAVEKLDDSTFIGFIGLSDQVFESSFTPCTDIGWRLAQDQWNKGYATEGAQRCLKYAFAGLGITKVHAIAPAINLRSQRIMQKIGMKKAAEFMHPLLINDERLRECVVYEIGK